MTTYYIDPAGDDFAAGSDVAPFGTVGRINNLALVAGDTVSFSGVTEISPIRGEIRTPVAGSAGNLITYSGTGGCVVSGAWNVTDGEVFEFQDGAVSARTSSNLWFTKFTAGVIDTWTRVGITAGITEETSAQLPSTPKCVKLDNGGGQCYLRQSFVMVSTPMRISVLRKNDATGTMQFDLQDAAATQYAQLTAGGVFSGWGALSRPVLANTTGWAYWTTGWISRDYAASIPSRVQLLSASGITYIQHLKIEYMATWQVHDAGNKVYKLQLPMTDAKATILLKSTKTAWALIGFAVAEDPHSYVPPAPSLASIQAGGDPGKAWFDHANKTLYYQCAANEALSDLHLEFMGGQQNAVYASANYTEFSGLKLRGSHSAGFQSLGCIVTTSDLDSKYNRGYGIYDGVGSTATHNDPVTNYNGLAMTGVYPGPLSSNGQLATGAGCVVVINRGEAIGNVDDGFQNDIGATLTLNQCVAHSNLSEQVSISEGDFTAIGCTFVEGQKVLSFGDYTLNDRHTSGTDASYTRTFIDNIIETVKITADGNTNIVASYNAVPAGVIQDAGAQTFTNQTGLVTDFTTSAFVDYEAADLRLGNATVLHRTGGYNTGNKTDHSGRRRFVPPSIGAYEPTSGDTPVITRTART